MKIECEKNEAAYSETEKRKAYLQNTNCRIIVSENASGFETSWINNTKCEIRVIMHKLSVLVSPRYYKHQSVNAV